MPFLFSPKEIFKERKVYFFVSIFVIAILSILVFSQQKVSAAAEVISCNDSDSRTLSVGAYTNSDGNTFSDGADLTLNVGTSSSCTFVLNLLGTDTAINLNSLTISSGVTLTHDYAPTSDGTYYKIDLNITTFLTVESGASINVSGKGLMSTSYGSGYGFSPDGTTISTSYGSGGDNGGAHGGYGGRNSWFHSSSAPYDSVSNPQLPGASGGAYAAGATGGGVVRIVAASSTVGGTINANGRNYPFSASGAGGTVYLNVATEILGAGSITANGGVGPSGYGAGGGGRIALYYTTLSGSLTAQAQGGDIAVAYSDGGAGTIYKKPSGQTYGDLVLDSGTASDSYYSTPLPYPIASSDAVAAYGNAYVFNSISLNNYAVLDFSSSLDPNGTGVSSAARKIYIANTASCSANYNDTSIANGQIQYNVGYVADPSSYQSNYICVAPEYVIELTSTSSTAKESVSSGTFEVVLPAVSLSDVTVDYAIYAPSSTATGGGVDYTLASGTVTITAGSTTNTATFSIIDDTAPESSEVFVVELSNPSVGVIGGNSRFAYTITDNDTPGVTLDESGGVSVTEGSTFPDTYTVVLDSAPTGDVIITATPDSQVTVSPSSLTFTSINWETPQTFSVLAVDDGYAESSHSGVITHSVSSTDLGYEGLVVSSTTSTISDNDFAGVTKTESGGSTSISENGSTDTYTLKLDTIPTADVTLTISPDAQTTVSPTSVTFTSTTWNVPQTITVTAVNDTDVEGSHSSSISHSAVSADSSYNSIFISGIYASVIDNDTAAVTVTVSGATTAVREGSTTDTYSINLETAPTADVVITPTSTSADISFSPSTLTFTSSNWLTPQVVTITAVDDGTFEGSDFASVTHSAVSGDTGYTGIYINSVSISIYDNDGFTITEPGGSTDITEGSTTDTFSVVLIENSYSDVTITLTTSTQYTLSTTTLYFHSGDWNTPQEVTVTAVDDAFVEGAQTVFVSSSISTYSFNYGNTVLSPISVNITDNDGATAGVTVTESEAATNITEVGATDTYTIVLNSAPTGNVAVSISPDTQSTVSTSSIVFTPTNWDTAQTITVSAVDDLVAEGVHTSTITHSATSTDGDYNGAVISSVTANITDNDTAGFTVSAISASTTEAGGTATFTVVLTSQPTGIVTTTVHSSDTTEGTINTSTLVFNVDSWNMARTVTVTGVDDTLDDEDVAYSIILDTATSTDDVNYAGVNPTDVSLSNIDNDTSGVTISETDASTDISEAGTTDSYTLVLNTQPAFDVTINIASDDQSTVSAASLLFTTSNWNTPQSVTVTAVNDNIDEGAHTSIISHSDVSDDATYNGTVISSVTANITDNDTSGITTSTISGTTSEAGASSTFTVVLTSRPTQNVDITIGSSDTSEGTVSTSSLRFNPSNWNTARTVVVTGVNDDVDDGDIAYSITVGPSSSDDPNYVGLSAGSVSVNNLDNDTAGVTLVESDGVTNSTEAGVTDSYTLVLNTEPVASVIVNISPDSQSSVSSSTLVFTSGDWNVPQSIVVTAVNDAVMEGAHTSNITQSVSSSDGSYEGLVVNAVTVNITDNDTAGFTVSAISGNTSEAGITAGFTVVLTSQPTGTVTTTVHSSNTSEGTINTSTLVFNADSWNMARTVTVTGVNDNVDDGDVIYSIILDTATSTGDANYAGMNPDDVSLSNIDNDTAGITLTQSSGTTNVSEDGETDSYTLVLDTQPIANVTVTVSSDAQSTLSTSSIVFTSDSWNLARTITVTAVDDAVIEGAHTSTITQSVSSDDPKYSARAIADLVANISDNDHGDFTVSAISGNTSEAGATATFTVVLTAPTTGIVTTTVHSSDTTEGTVNTTTLVFDAASWNIPRTVTVTGVDDSVDDGNVSYSIILDTATSTDDVNYQNIDPGDVILSNTDNDTAGFTISEISGNTTEATGTATFTLSLTSQPTATVRIPVSSPDTSEGTVSTSSLVFSPDSWNIARTVTVTGVNDDIDDGDVAYSIVLDIVSSTDESYSATNPSDVTVVNMNDDVAGVTRSESDDATLVEEGGDTDTYTLVLDSEPTSNVTITLSSDEFSTLSTSSIIFTSLNWDTAQTITVTAVDDTVLQGLHASTITHAVSSLDSNYNGIVLSDLSASVTDNEVPISHNNGGSDGTGTSETGNTDTTNNTTNSEVQTPETANPTETPVGDPDSTIPYIEQTVVLDTTRAQEVKVGTEVHHVTNVSATDASATIIIQSEPLKVDLLKNETKLLDTDGDKKNDMSVTYLGLLAGLPQFVFRDVTISPDTKLIDINHDAPLTTSTQVLLTFQASSTAMIAISNTSSFAGATFQPYRKTLFWTLSSGNGKKTVYVRFQRKNGYLFDASDSINLTLHQAETLPQATNPAVAICEFALGKALKVKDSPAVYLIEKPHDKKGIVQENIPCAKRVFPNSAIYFSYFSSWKDIILVTKAQIEAIPNDALRFIPLGPRFTPVEGTLLKAIDDSKVYIFFGAQKHWIESETVFRAAGYLFDWVKTAVSSLVESIPTGSSIDKAVQIPAQIQGKNQAIVNIH